MKLVTHRLNVNVEFNENIDMCHGHFHCKWGMSKYFFSFRRIERKVPLGHIYEHLHTHPHDYTLR